MQKFAMNKNNRKDSNQKKLFEELQRTLYHVVKTIKENDEIYIHFLVQMMDQLEIALNETSRKMDNRMRATESKFIEMIFSNINKFERILTEISK